MPPLDHNNNTFRGNSDLGFRPKIAPAAFSVSGGKKIAKSLTSTGKKIKRTFSNADIMLEDFSDLPLQANAHDQHMGKSLYTFPEKRTQGAPTVTTTDGELITSSLEKETSKKVINISKETAMPRPKKCGVNTDGLAEVRPVERRDIRSWLRDKFDIPEDSSEEENHRKRKRRVKKLRTKRQPGNVDDNQFQDAVRKSNEHIVSTHECLQKPEQQSATLRDKRELDEDEDDEDAITGGVRKLVTEPFSKTHNVTDFRIAHFQLPDHMGGRCGPSGTWRDACPEAYFRMLADMNTGSETVLAMGVLIIVGLGAIVTAMAMCFYRCRPSRKPRREMAGRTGAMAELEPEDKV